MKIRLMGTKEELMCWQELFLRQKNNPDVNYVEVSELYINRAPSKLYRLYVDISYKDTAIDITTHANIPKRN